MAGTTTRHGLPYPTPPDNIVDYPAVAQTFATTVDSLLPKIKYGTATVNVSSSSSGTVEIDISSAGFTAAPTGVSAIAHNFSYFTYYASGGTQSASTLTLGVRRYDGTSATVSVTIRYIAVGV